MVVYELFLKPEWRYDLLDRLSVILIPRKTVHLLHLGSTCVDRCVCLAFFFYLKSKISSVLTRSRGLTSAHHSARLFFFNSLFEIWLKSGSLHVGGCIHGCSVGMERG